MSQNASNARNQRDRMRIASALENAKKAAEAGDTKRAEQWEEEAAWLSTLIK